jgi:type III secretion protein J
MDLSINNGLKQLLRITFIALISVTAACSSKVTIFNNLNEIDANEVYSTLLEAGFTAKKIPTDNGFSIEVPSDMTREALTLLSSQGLPKERKGSFGEVFKKEGLISSPLEEKARYLFALSQELEQTLMVMDGVISARVHVVLPERATPGEPLAPSSVAVFVKHEQDSSFPAYIGQIRELVLSSIPNMRKNPQQDSVSIVAIPSKKKVDQPIGLIWYGPIAIKDQGKLYFLSIVYLLIFFWIISLAVVYLLIADPTDRPKFLNKFFKTETKASEGAS